MKILTGDVKKFLNLTIGITQQNYPETLGQMFIINAGILFSATWVIIKPLLDPVTVSKIHIFSGSGKKELLELIGAQNLPQFLGGEASDEIRSNPGVWSEEWQRSLESKTIKHANQEVVTMYFGMAAQQAIND